MHCYRINNSNSVYVCDEYINECIKASKKFNQKYGVNTIVESKAIASKINCLNQKQETILPLSENTILAHKLWGNGRVLSTDKKGVMTVQFSQKIVKFVYPDAIKQGYLTVA